MTIYTSNSGQEFIILSREGKNCIIQFTETGSVRKANIDNINAGKVKDMYALTRYGVGYLGDYKKTEFWKQAKELWNNMLKRCYCEKDQRGYFHKGTTVDARWLCFANFLEDLPKLKNFDLWLKGKNEGFEKYNLDKDLQESSCNVYSLLTCGFEKESVNKAAGARNGKPYTKKIKVNGEHLTNVL